MLLLGKTQKKQPGDLAPTVQDLPCPPPFAGGLGRSPPEAEARTEKLAVSSIGRTDVQQEKPSNKRQYCVPSKDRPTFVCAA